MAVPKFESESDLKIERAILKSINKKYELEFTKNDGEFTKIDYTIHFPKYDKTIYAEIRCRYINHNQFGDVFISHRKWKECKEIAKEAGLSFWLIYKFNDGIFFLNETHTTDEAPRFVKWGGSNIIRAGAVSDREMMLHIPSNEFRFICKYDESLLEI